MYGLKKLCLGGQGVISEAGWGHFVTTSNAELGRVKPIEKLFQDVASHPRLVNFLVMANRRHLEADHLALSL